MNSVIKTLNKKAFLLIASAAFILAACPIGAYAENHGAISVRAGAASNYQRAELAWESPSLWSHRFTGNGSRLDLFAELGLAYWHARGSRSPSDLWQVNAIPMLRWTLENGVYLEAGAGATLMSRTHFADESISTAFQFGDHIGVGMHLTDSSRLGVRYSHFSNADIKKPNPGLNVLQVLYTYQY